MDIFEILDEKFDLYNQVNDLNKMLYKEGAFYSGFSHYSFACVFDAVLFRGWKYSKGRSSLFDLIYDVDLGEKFFDGQISIKDIENEVEVYKVLQLNLSLLSYGEKHKKELTNSYTLYRSSFFQEAANKIAYICDKAGIKIIKHETEDYYLLVPRDEKVKSVVENVDKDTAYLLYEYTSPILKNNVKEKRRILKLLTNNYEALIKTYSSKYNSGPIHNILEDLSTILNNYELRHPNLNPSVPQYYNEALTHYSDSQWIEIYDTAYQLILMVTMIDSYITILTKTVDRHKNLL